MANIKGGGLKGRSIVGTAVYFDGKPGKDGKQQAPFYMVDAQLDLRDPANEPAKQSNPHLESHSFTAQDGSSRTAHGIRMTVGQVEAIKNGVGADNFRSVTPDNRNVEFAGKMDLMFTQRADGRKTMLIDPKGTIEPSTYGWTPDMMKGQAELKAQAKQNVAAEKAAAKQAAPVEATAAEKPAKATKKRSAKAPKAKTAAAAEVAAPEAEAAEEFEA